MYVLKVHFKSLLQASLSWLRQAHVLQVSKMCQPLDDLRDLAGSDSVDTFVLSYTSLLQVCPPALQLLCMAGLHSIVFKSLSHALRKPLR